MSKTAAVTGTPDKVTLNFYLPHSIEFQGEKVRRTHLAHVQASLLPPPLADSSCLLLPPWTHDCRWTRC